MVPEIVDYGLVAAYLLLMGLLAVRYRRGEIADRKLTLYVGMCLTWLAYGLLQVTQDGPIPTGTTLNDGLDALAVVLLVAGIYLLYRGWRSDDGDSETAVPNR
ncbi:hypothetical protein C475_16361 [Halosimplex carlsbadense 2-9-1]|uniref:Uncharacterized protein n=1 Tax=Halosimplex carlsbadense 2-9-1 TaxID=797114 RepID=M0CJZ5_9EURY|nr:hypothetical protein [Halosimplex carlsbadense]ELZ22692.1 hypothetical protein C475_16361 [Halosimplex carlsbadense 2-9-1]